MTAHRPTQAQRRRTTVRAAFWGPLTLLAVASCLHSLLTLY